MNHIPVTDSTISGDYLAVLLREKYGFSDQTTCRIFRTGINHSYMVTDKENKYVFRIYSYQWRTETEISEELRLLNELRTQGVSVSYPIQGKDEQYILKLQAPEGLRYGVLFSYAKGEKIRAFKADAAYNIGKVMAQFHQASQHLSLNRTEYSVNTLVTLAYQQARVHFPASNEEMQFIEKAEQAITEAISKEDVRKLRKGVVHLDIWYDNMHMNNGSEITIFDFDFCGSGWLMLDIAYFIMQVYQHEPDKAFYKVKREAFLAGYESVLEIPQEEKNLFPYVGLSIWIFYLGVQSQRFDNWSNIFLSVNYLSRFMGMVKDWLRYEGIEIIARESLKNSERNQ